MKRKFAMMVLVATMTASMMTGCGAKSDNAGAAQQEETTQQEGTATEGQSEETSTFTGTPAMNLLSMRRSRKDWTV